MHAIRVTVAVDDTADIDLNHHLDQVVADISGLPGFVHGYWLAPSNGSAEALVVFETEAQARDTAPTVGERTRDGAARFTSVELALVAASA